MTGQQLEQAIETINGTTTIATIDNNGDENQKKNMGATAIARRLRADDLFERAHE